MAVNTTDIGIARLHRHCAIVLDYVDKVKELAGKAQQPGFTDEDWAPLRDYVAVEGFRRRGVFGETQTWPEYLAMLTEWAGKTQFGSTFHSISEAPGVVYLEMEDRNTVAGETSVAHSLTVYRFNESDQIRQLEIFLQGYGWRKN